MWKPPAKPQENKRERPAEAIDAIEVPSLTRLCDRKEEKTGSDSEDNGLSALRKGQ